MADAIGPFGGELELKHYIWLFQFAINDLKTKIEQSELEIIRLERFPDEPYVPSNLGPRSKRIESHFEFLGQYRRIQQFAEKALNRLHEASAEEFAAQFVASTRRKS